MQRSAATRESLQIEQVKREQEIERHVLRTQHRKSSMAAAHGGLLFKSQFEHMSRVIYEQAVPGGFVSPASPISPITTSENSPFKRNRGRVIQHEVMRRLSAPTRGSRRSGASAPTRVGNMPSLEVPIEQPTVSVHGHVTWDATQTIQAQNPSLDDATPSEATSVPGTKVVAAATRDDSYVYDYDGNDSDEGEGDDEEWGASSATVPPPPTFNVEAVQMKTPSLEAPVPPSPNALAPGEEYDSNEFEAEATFVENEKTGNGAPSIVAPPNAGKSHRASVLAAPTLPPH